MEILGWILFAIVTSIFVAWGVIYCICIALNSSECDSGGCSWSDCVDCKENALVATPNNRIMLACKRVIDVIAAFAFLIGAFILLIVCCSILQKTCFGCGKKYDGAHCINCGYPDDCW